MLNIPRILIIEDSPEDAELACRELRSARMAFESMRVESKDAYLSAIEEFRPDVILSDFSLPQFDGLEALRLLRELSPDTPFILCTGTMSEETAVECMKEGAFDYILKTSLKRLPSAIEKALEARSARAEKMAALDALRESEEKFRSIVETTREWIWEIDPEGRLTYCNPAVLQILGYRADELIGRDVFELVHEEDVERVAAELGRYASNLQAWTRIEARLRHKDDSVRYLESSAVPILKNGDFVGFLGAARDITERKRAEDRLRASEELYRLLFERNPHPAWVTDPETQRFLAVNQEAIRRYGYSHAEFLGLTLRDVRPFEPDSDMPGYRLESRTVAGAFYSARHRTRDGSIIDVEVATQFISFNGTPAKLALITDVTEKVRAKEQLLHDALHDALTGLANRNLFTDHLRLTIARARREQTEYAVLHIDCDRLKLVNDSLGHTAGDQVLKQLSKRLEALVRPGDLVARFEGDEFAVLLDNLAAEDDALRMASRIHEAMEEPIVLGGERYVLTIAVGIAVGGGARRNGEDVLREAAIAMHAAKAKGPAQSEVFRPEVHQQAGDRLRMEKGMRDALHRGEYELHYQPIVNLRTGELAAFESLIRWRHPERGLIPPLEFIPLAEENGFIVQLGQWTVEESCRQLREWQHAFARARSLSISVNLSCKQFMEPNLAAKMEAMLSSTGLDPRFLKLEITESHVMENSELAISLMDQIHRLGTELCMDDFGTGYSSLSYLHRLPVSYLKIDRSFVSSMIENPVNGEIVQTVINLAKSLRLKVVAEGVETHEQMVRLADLGCDFGQGYFLSRPLPPEQAVRLIAQDRSTWHHISDEALVDSHHSQSRRLA